MLYAPGLYTILPLLNVKFPLRNHFNSRDLVTQTLGDFFLLLCNLFATLNNPKWK